MKSTGRIQFDAEESERLDNEMENEISMQKEHLSKYIDNINYLLGKNRSKEVRKSMINFLVETL